MDHPNEHFLVISKVIIVWFESNIENRVEMKDSALSTYEEQKSFLKLSYLTF